MYKKQIKTFAAFFPQQQLTFYKNKEQNSFLNIMEKKNFYNFSFLNNYVNISKVQFYSVVCNLIAVVHTMPLSV